MKTTFRNAEGGNVAIIFAVAAVPLLAMAGMGIDYSRAAKAKTQLRTAVDAAAMAAASASDADRTTVGQNFLASNLAQSGLSNLSSSFVVNADGTLTASASGSVKTVISGVFGASTIGVGASTTVGNIAQPPKELTFNAITASGYYWKQVDLILQATVGGPESTLASYVYQGTNMSNYTGTLTATYNNGSGTMVAGPNSKKLTLPANYANLYLKMTIYTDGCGPGMVHQHGGAVNPWVCVPAGSPYTAQSCTGSGRNKVCSDVTAYEAQKDPNSKVTLTTNPKDPSAAAQSHNLFVQDLSATDVADGVLRNGVWIRNVQINDGTGFKTYKMAMMPNNKTPSIFDILPCPTPAEGVIQQWEDTTWNGTGSSPPGSWTDSQDFTFRVNTSGTQGSCAPNANYNGSVTTTSTGAMSASNGAHYFKN